MQRRSLRLRAAAKSSHREGCLRRMDEARSCMVRGRGPVGQVCQAEGRVVVVAGADDVLARGNHCVVVEAPARFFPGHALRLESIRVCHYHA